MTTLGASEPVYDEHARLYVEFVDNALRHEPSLFGLLAEVIRACIGKRLDGAVVCDVACGEGYLSRYLIRRGAQRVVGVDLSVEMVAERPLVIAHVAGVVRLFKPDRLHYRKALDPTGSPF